MEGCPFQTLVGGHDIGGFRFWSSRSDDYRTDHGHVLSRVVSRLIRISVFPRFGEVLTYSLNNTNVVDRERIVERIGVMKR